MRVGRQKRVQTIIPLPHTINISLRQSLLYLTTNLGLLSIENGIKEVGDDERAFAELSLDEFLRQL